MKIKLGKFHISVNVHKQNNGMTNSEIKRIEHDMRLKNIEENHNRRFEFGSSEMYR